MYIKMAGQSGLRKASSHAILSANYIANTLKNKFKIFSLYKMFRDISAALCASSGGSNLNNDKKHKYIITFKIIL